MNSVPEPEYTDFDALTDEDIRWSAMRAIAELEGRIPYENQSVRDMYAGKKTGDGYGWR